MNDKNYFNELIKKYISDVTILITDHCNKYINKYNVELLEDFRKITDELCDGLNKL